MNGDLIHHDLHRVALHFPQSIAVTDGHTALTFCELDGASDQLGYLLVNLGISRGDRVIYFLKRSIDCIIATVGILKSGAAYVPLDQKTPAVRWQRIIQDATPRAIICNSETLQQTLGGIMELGVPPFIICLDSPVCRPSFKEQIFFSEEIQVASTVLSSEGVLEDIACVLYTSGSTGTPKGVMITHGNLRNYIDWAVGYFRITSNDRILGTAPFHFDMSTFDIFCSLSCGATLCMATNEMLLFPENLVRFMEQEEVTIWKGVSSLLMYMCRAHVVQPGRMSTLQTIIFAGESLDAQYLAQWMQAFPEKSFFNGYGPTEATGVSLCHHVDRIPDRGQLIPIGRPCKGAQVVLVGDDGFPVGPNEVGELCIAGPCLAKGYLNDRESTSKCFTPPPDGCENLGDLFYHTGDLACQNSDGNYIFISRKDHQIKWMGYRIEPAEIEVNLLAHPQVRDAVVLLASFNINGLTELTAFFEADENLNPLAIAQFLERRLPPYMIPRRLLQMESIPRNERGKIAREEVIESYLKFKEENCAAVR